MESDPSGNSNSSFYVEADILNSLFLYNAIYPSLLFKFTLSGRLSISLCELDALNPKHESVNIIHFVLYLY